MLTMYKLLKVEAENAKVVLQGAFDDSQDALSCFVDQ
jgi:hypothetical protein